MTALDQFFAPLVKGAGSSGAPSGGVAGVAVGRLDYSIPAPHDDDDTTTGADAWDTVYLAEIALPPLGSGRAVLKCPIKIKVDKAAKTGAAKPAIKVTGGEAIEGTITVEFVQEALPAMVAAARTLYPGAGPFPIRHPKATMAKLEAVQIVGWADPPDPDPFGKFTWTIQYLQVSMAAQAGTGTGSGVATKPGSAWHNAKHGDIPLDNGSVVSADGAATKAKNTHKGTYQSEAEAAAEAAADAAQDGIAKKIDAKKAAKGGASP